MTIKNTNPFVGGAIIPGITNFGPAPGTSKTVGPSDISSLVVIVDWSDVACFGVQPFCFDQTPANAIGDLIFQELYTNSQTKKFVTQTPVHLIGHSRGGGAVSRFAYKLGELGIWTDHVTYLDPQPVTAFAGDFDARAWNTAIYVENYLEDKSVVHGQPVFGAKEWNLDSILCPVLCLQSIMQQHSEVHQYYHGTVDTSSHWDGEKTLFLLPVDNILDSWYASPNPARGLTGYAFSRLAQTSAFPGNRNAAGIHQSFPGSAGANRRDPITRPFGFSYPNVLLLSPSSYLAQPGATIHFQYVSQDLDSPGYTVSLDLDDDTNPFNTTANTCA